jgi:glycerol-3-phosphate cytidylyltransferase
MTTVFVPGVFDVFHIGHLRYLKSASQFGDHVIVGVQDDRAVAACKGAAPIIPLWERMLIVEHLKFVDEVVSYTDVYQAPLLKTLGIDVFVVGEEYGADDKYPDQRRSLAWCAENNVKVGRVPRTMHISSTDIRGRLREFWNGRAQLANELQAGVTVLGSFNGDQDKVRAETAREVELIVGAVAEPKKKSILDLGCGDGRHLEDMCKHFGRVVGVDFAETLIDLSRARLAKLGVNAELHVADATEFTTDEKFDVILVSGLFPYLDDEQAARLMTNLMKYSTPSTQVLVRSSIGVNKRIDVVNQFSQELKTRYTAYYRTNEEMLDLFGRHGWYSESAHSLYQHRSDTAVWWYQLVANEARHQLPTNSRMKLEVTADSLPAVRRAA